MASLVIGVAGAVVGSFFGPVGTSIGFALGSAVGNILFPNKPALAPHDLHIQGSSYGAFLKIVYGTVRVAGNVIWETDLQQHDGGGKGKTPTQQTFTASFRVALCETAVVAVRRFWAAGRLNYDVNQPNGPTVPFVLYDGNAAQLPDPTEEAAEGVGNVPAYRGHSDVTFSDWDMTQFGNSIPQLSFELQTKGAAGVLSIVQANYATGFSHVSFPIIMQWDATLITVGDMAQSTSKGTTVPLQQDYDLTTLAATGAHVPPPINTYPIYWTGPSPHPKPLGNYVYSDGSVTPLWAVQFAANTASAVLCPILTGSCTAPFNGSIYIPEDTTKFLHAAGVPDTGYLNGCVLSADGTALYVFVGPSSAGANDTWYKIVDGMVDATGTISPAGLGDIWGDTATPTASMNVRKVGMAENGGQYIWVFNDPTWTCSIYKFAAGNLADWGNGTLVIANGTYQSVGQDSGMRVISDGRCAIAKGTSLVELSRLGPDAPTFLDEVVADLLTRGGVASIQYDVTALADIVVDGFIIETQMTVRAALEILMPVYFFDIVESDGVLKCVLRGADPIVTFLEDDLAAHLDSDDLPSILSCVHTQDVDLPSGLVIAYMNKDADYQINTQTSQRMVGGSRSVQTIQVPLVLTDAHAKKIVDAWLFDAWWTRDVYTWYSSRKYAKYEPTDVCIVQGKTLRITSKTEGANGVIKWEGVPSRKENFVQAGAGGAAFAAGGQTLSPVAQPAGVLLLDVPLVNDADDPNGIYVAMAGTVSSTWHGANLYKSSDSGTTYDLVATKVTPATMGTATTALGDFFGGNVFDESNSVTVVIGAGGGTLSSANELAVLNGTNMMLIGNELIQAKNCVLTAASTYRLTGLLRGRRGTEWATAYHVAGERFVVMDANVTRAPVLLSELGQLRLWKSVSFGLTLAGTSAFPFTSQGVALRPYSPAHVGGGCDASGNVTINWQRRTRIGGAWADYVDVPLSEATESYVVQIWNAGFTQIARVISGLTSPTCSYTAAQQTTDFGATQLHVYVTVTQIGAFGLGVPQKGTIPGAGASDTASPLSPVPPAGAPPPQGGSTCPAPVTEDTYAWVAGPARIQNTDFFPGQTWVVKFTTGAVEGGGYISLYEYQGPPCPRYAVLSASPCGPPVAPFATSGFNDIGPTISFHVGPNNPHPGYVATLAFNTTYYFCCTTSQVSAAAVTLSH